MRFLKKHPFAVEAYFDSSLVLTFAVPKEQLIKLIPECLDLDTFKDKWAFIAIAMVQTKDLRPKGFPRFMGNDFFLIGYRIFVRYTNNSNKRLRGLYILKSETDKYKMQVLGNIFTQYNYTTTDISQSIENDTKVIRSVKSNFELVVDQSTNEVKLPADSPFADWKDARKFAGPLPHTFTYDKVNGTVLTIQGLRQNWTPESVKVKSYHFDFLNSLNLQNVVLANAFEIQYVPYSWSKGKIEKWR
jgi:hypothetical protein